MVTPGFTAEASLGASSRFYRSVTSELGLHWGEVLILPQQLRARTMRIPPPINLPPLRPCRPRWFCDFQHELCQALISRCTSACYDEAAVGCAGSLDPDCYIRVGQLCSGRCVVACDQAYQDCLECR
jgi:hypothetical protein